MNEQNPPFETSQADPSFAEPELDPELPNRTRAAEVLAELDGALARVAELELELGRAKTFQQRFEALEGMLEFAGLELAALRHEVKPREVLEGTRATPRDGLALCQHEGCDAPATHSYVWPDTATEYRECERHAQHAAVTVYTMGRVLDLRPISVPAVAGVA